MGVPPQHADGLGRQVEVARRERALEQVEQVDGVALDRLRPAGDARREVGARQVELGDLAAEVVDQVAG